MSFPFCLLKASFGDFAPYMIASDASLDALNKELPWPVTMTRFRPNIVVSGPEAFEEVCLSPFFFGGGGSLFLFSTLTWNLSVYTLIISSVRNEQYHKIPVISPPTYKPTQL